MPSKIASPPAQDKRRQHAEKAPDNRPRESSVAQRPRPRTVRRPEKTPRAPSPARRVSRPVNETFTFPRHPRSRWNRCRRRNPPAAPSPLSTGWHGKINKASRNPEGERHGRERKRGTGRLPAACARRAGRERRRVRRPRGGHPTPARHRGLVRPGTRTSTSAEENPMAALARHPPRLPRSSPNLHFSGASSQPVERVPARESLGRTFSTIRRIAGKGQERLKGVGWWEARARRPNSRSCAGVR